MKTLTQLFSFSEKPAYPGVYAVSFLGGIGHEYSYWDGAQWYCVSFTPEGAVRSYVEDTRSKSIYMDPPEYSGWKGVEATPWFPMSERPVRNGVYQIKLVSERVVYSKWADGAWHWMADYPEEAARDIMKSPSLACSPVNLSWRGCLL